MKYLIKQDEKVFPKITQSSKFQFLLARYSKYIYIYKIESPNIKKKEKETSQCHFQRTKSSPKIPKSKETDKSQTPKSKRVEKERERERARGIAINHLETYHQASPASGTSRQYIPSPSTPPPRHSSISSRIPPLPSQ